MALLLRNDAFRNQAEIFFFFDEMVGLNFAEVAWVVKAIVLNDFHFVCIRILESLFIFNGEHVSVNGLGSLREPLFSKVLPFPALRSLLAS